MPKRYTLTHLPHPGADHYRFEDNPEDGPGTRTTIAVNHPKNNVETAHLLRSTVGVIGPTKYGLDIDEPIPVCVARLIIDQWTQLSGTTVPLPEGNLQ